MDQVQKYLTFGKHKKQKIIQRSQLDTGMGCQTRAMDMVHINYGVSPVRQ